jgi:hypothetical protein
VKPNAKLTKLLRDAELGGIQAMAGQPATPENLRELCKIIRGIIIGQVFCGDWKTFGVAPTDAPKFVLLNVDAVVPAVRAENEPAIKITYDWRLTPLKTIQVVSEKRGAR